MATLALNSLSYLLRIVVVYAPFLVSGRLSIHSILLRFYVQILGLIIQGGERLGRYVRSAAPRPRGAAFAPTDGPGPQGDHELRIVDC